jgi:flagellar protein FliO/FliZ
MQGPRPRRRITRRAAALLLSAVALAGPVARGDDAPAGLRVLGRTALTPKHSVYLLKAGDRVLIVGTGPQGAPSLLGEMDPETGPTGRSGGES